MADYLCMGKFLHDISHHGLTLTPLSSSLCLCFGVFSGPAPAPVKERQEDLLQAVVLCFSYHGFRCEIP